MIDPPDLSDVELAEMLHDAVKIKPYFKLCVAEAARRLRQPTQVAQPPAIVDREMLDRKVREIWIAWAKEQAVCKPSWLVEWDNLSEPDREVDRRIGEQI